MLWLVLWDLGSAGLCGSGGGKAESGPAGGVGPSKDGAGGILFDFESGPEGGWSQVQRKGGIRSKGRVESGPGIGVCGSGGRLVVRSPFASERGMEGAGARTGSRAGSESHLRVGSESPALDLNLTALDLNLEI